MVVVTGSATKEAKTAAELLDIFQQGSKSRHVASTSKFSSRCSMCPTYLLGSAPRSSFILQFTISGQHIHTVTCCVSLFSEMNAESSRSHLIVGIVITSTNLATGTVVSGKVCSHFNYFF